MSLLSKISFIFFALFGAIFFTGSFFVLKGSTAYSALLVNNIFDLPFFAFGIIFLFSRLHDLLKKYKKNSYLLNFLLAFFATLSIVALIYLNIGILDKF